MSAITKYCSLPIRINNSVNCSFETSVATIPVILGVKTPDIDVDKLITILLNVPPIL